MKEQVLVLNDDNHPSCFVTRTAYYSDALTFMRQCLLDPHHITYELRKVYFCDPTEELLEQYSNDEEKFMKAFDLLACHSTYKIEKMSKEEMTERIETFQKFWEFGEKEFHYV